MPRSAGDISPPDRPDPGLKAVFGRLLQRARSRSTWETTGWVFASYVLGAVVAMAVQVVLTRALGMTEVGILVTTAAWGLIFEQAIMARGAETALSLFARKAHSDRRPWGALAIELMLIDLVWLGLCAALFLGAAWLLAPPGVDRGLLGALAVGTVMQFAWGACKAGQIVFEPVRRQAQLEIVTTVGALVLPVAGVLGGGLHGYGWGMAAVGAFRSLSALSFVWPHLKRGHWSLRRREVSWRELRYLGGLAMVRASSIALSGQLDILLLAASGGGTTVATYSRARIVSSTPGRVFAPVWTLARKAVVTGIHHGGIREARGQITLAALAMLVLGAPAFLIVWLWGRPLLTLLFGPAYGEAALALSILLPSSWFFDVMTGWAKFAAAVAPRKLVTSGAFVGRCLIAGGLWWFWKPDSAAEMAWIVAAANLVTGVIFWLALFNDRWLIGAAPQPIDEVTPLDGPEPG